MPSKKLILIMIDGISADYFEAHGQRLPYLSQLARGGYQVKRMKSPVPATSMPGRASLLSGFAADKHGIYGNRLLRDGGFTPADSEDMRVPTIASLATSAGLDVACIGHALIRPDDASIYVPPCWMRGPDFTKVTASGQEWSLLQIKDPLRRLSGVQLPSMEMQASTTDPLGMSEYLIADQQMVGIAAALLRASSAPDVIITEINVTDSAQHYYGYESEEANFAVSFADGLVGLCLDSIRQRNANSAYNLAILSDHGHDAINKTIYVDRVIPGLVFDTEGSSLHVLINSATQRVDVERRLASVGAEAWDGDHLPPELREQIAMFVAPSGHDFAKAPENAPAGDLVGESHKKSMHGLRPGDPADDRFCLFFGPDVPNGVIETADAESFAPTVSALLDLPLTSFPGRPLFTPSVSARSF
ncbi:MAG: alkaline phosphatase family protein [Mesorhizobium sp.]|uniref:alkaline phosphatase family protein n=1 Tax=Mesorhizobium sp. TaxID=1871066 RepID=UPI000FE8AF90|nr:alkaline phosphatase family protein [Mesorhizobium sp.]RWH59329.1 MAG: alkaline phosphatase family protein [Mesorhizobium sp.]